MAGSSLTPFVREAPPVASYEAVVAASRSDDAPKIPGPELSDAQLSAPMHNAAWLAKCGVAESTKVTVRVAIQHGAPVGVSVYATPEDEAIVSCVQDHVTALRWPDNLHLDMFTTTY